MNENPTINYAFALKNYSQNGKGRSMKKFCEDEGYDYDKFLQYSRRGLNRIEKATGKSISGRNSEETIKEFCQVLL